MRTPLTLEADVARALAAEQRRRKTNLKAAVNAALRVGLGLESPRAPRRRFVVKPHAGGFKLGLDPHKLNHLAAELEDDAILKRQARLASTNTGKAPPYAASKRAKSRHIVRASRSGCGRMS